MGYFEFEGIRKRRLENPKNAMPILAAVGFQSDRKSFSRSVSLSGFFGSHVHTVKTAQFIRFSSRVALRSRVWLEANFPCQNTLCVLGDVA